MMPRPCATLAAALFTLCLGMVAAACTTAGEPSTPTPLPKTVAGKTFAGPDQVLEAGKRYEATITTAKGEIVLELLADVAPVTVNSFVFLARNGFYDGLTFHRLSKNFVVQGGDPTGIGSGGPGYEFDEDRTDLPNTRGTVAMAKLDGLTRKAGSQFFINLADNARLDAADNRFNVFARVTAGMDIVDQLVKGDVMTKVTVTVR
jgi:peptidyl-prolyl cis-trans isomerase B (cyclophilin B)